LLGTKKFYNISPLGEDIHKSSYNVLTTIWKVEKVQIVLHIKHFCTNNDGNNTNSSDFQALLSKCCFPRPEATAESLEHLISEDLIGVLRIREWKETSIEIRCHNSRKNAKWKKAKWKKAKWKNAKWKIPILKMPITQMPVRQMTSRQRQIVKMPIEKWQWDKWPLEKCQLENANCEK
jgi:hypothetical protein